MPALKRDGGQGPPARARTKKHVHAETLMALLAKR